MDAPAALAVYVAGDDTRAAFSISDTARLLGVHRHTVATAVRTGQLYATRIASKVLIPAWSIRELLDDPGFEGRPVNLRDVSQ